MMGMMAMSFGLMIVTAVTLSSVVEVQFDIARITETMAAKTADRYRSDDAHRDFAFVGDRLLVIEKRLDAIEARIDVISKK